MSKRNGDGLRLFKCTNKIIINIFPNFQDASPLCAPPRKPSS